MAVTEIIFSRQPKTHEGHRWLNNGRLENEIVRDLPSSIRVPRRFMKTTHSVRDPNSILTYKATQLCGESAIRVVSMGTTHTLRPQKRYTTFPMTIITMVTIERVLCSKSGTSCLQRTLTEILLPKCQCVTGLPWYSTLELPLIRCMDSRQAREVIGHYPGKWSRSVQVSVKTWARGNSWTSDL